MDIAKPCLPCIPCTCYPGEVELDLRQCVSSCHRNALSKVPKLDNECYKIILFFTDVMFLVFG